MSSSSSEVPLDVYAAQIAQQGLDKDRGSSPVPDWITSFQSPAGNQAASPSSSSSDDFAAHPAPAPDVSLPEAAATQPSAAATKTKTKTPAQQNKATAKGRSRPDVAKESAPATAAVRPEAPGKTPQAGSASKPGKQQQAASALPAAEEQDADPASTQLQPGNAPAEPFKAKATRVLADGDLGKGEVPLMLPDKLAAGKYLMELEPAKDGADDLTGDAGAVGRMLVSGRGEEASLQIDLKGALYNAALAPSACTLAVINLGPSEARVEMLASHFLQLDRVQGLGDVEGGDLHLWQDEDQEQDAGYGVQSLGDVETGDLHLWQDEDQEQDYATLDDQPKIKKGRKIKAQGEAGDKKATKKPGKTVSKGKAGVKKGGQKKGGGRKGKGK